MRRDSRASGCSAPSSSSTPTTARRRSSRRSCVVGGGDRGDQGVERRAAARRRRGRRRRRPARDRPRAGSARPGPRRRRSRWCCRAAPARRRSRRAVQQPRERDRGVGAVGLELERAPQVVLAAGGDQPVGLGGQQAVEELRDLRGRLRADELVDDLAVAEGLDRRDALDAEGVGDLLVGVGVELGEVEVRLALADLVLEHRRELAAGPAPGGPEVDHDGHVVGALRRRRARRWPR